MFHERPVDFDVRAVILGKSDRAESLGIVALDLPRSLDAYLYDTP